jgi:hypothetical protein
MFDEDPWSPPLIVEANQKGRMTILIIIVANCFYYYQLSTVSLRVM